MDNNDRLDILRIGYKDLLISIPETIEQAAQCFNRELRVIASNIKHRQAYTLADIMKMSAHEDIDDHFVDELICRYSGLQGCLLDKEFMSDPDPDVQKVISEYLDTVDENLRELVDQDLMDAPGHIKPAFYCALFGNHDDAELGVRLNLIDAIIHDVQALTKLGISPFPAPEYPSGLTSLSLFWGVAHPETQ